MRFGLNNVLLDVPSRPLSRSIYTVCLHLECWPVAVAEKHVFVQRTIGSCFGAGLIYSNTILSILIWTAARRLSSRITPVWSVTTEIRCRLICVMATRRRGEYYTHYSVMVKNLEIVSGVASNQLHHWVVVTSLLITATTQAYRKDRINVFFTGLYISQWHQQVVHT